MLLHKIAFDYMTLFDVYEYAIDPDLLESKIKKGSAGSLKPISHCSGKKSPTAIGRLTPGLVAVCKDRAIQWEAENASRKNPVPA